MKKTVLFPIVLSILFAVGRPSFILGQDAPMAHVAVVQFSNQTGSASYDAACKAATDTLLLTLRQLGRYRLQSEDGVGSGEEALRAMAEEKHLDFIMYGTMATAQSGGIDCRLSVFDRAKGKTTLSQSLKSTGVLDIFDTADELVVSVLESMTGSHFGFGSFTFKNTGENGSYGVLMDAFSVGKDLASLERVLNGRHEVTITQKRMLGERAIARASVEVKEGETVEISFAVPYLMDDEKAKVEGLKSAIRAEWDAASAEGDVDAKIAEFASLFGDLSYSPRLSSYKEEVKQLTAEWTLRKNRRAIEDAAWDPKVELLDVGGGIYAEENAELVATLFELRAGKALGGGDIDGALECFGNALMLSTRYLGGKRMTDYAYAVTTLKDFQDKAGAASAGNSDKDMKTAFGALIQAGQRFYGLKDQVMAGTACALVASDFATTVSVDGGEYADAPLTLQPTPVSREVSVQPKGKGKPVTLTAVAGGRLLFIQDGFASFGKITLGYIPGSIQVDVDQKGARVTLDDEDPVEAPHLFENVAPGNHKVSIADLTVGARVYPGIKEEVSVEPGKRVKLQKNLEIGRAQLRVEGILKGSKMMVEGEERTLTENPDGAMVFEGPVDAGLSRIEIVHQSATWKTVKSLSVNESSTLRLENMSVQYTPERRSIEIDGKTEEWMGIAPMFGAGTRSFIRNMDMPGSLISGGTICRDDKNLYIKMEFSNGNPALHGNGSRGLNLRQNSQNISFQTLVSNGKTNSCMWNAQNQRNINDGLYAVGSSFLEMRFPLSRLPKQFDLTLPIQASLYCWLGDQGNVSYTPQIDIVIGK
jgi:hypothetical protein